MLADLVSTSVLTEATFIYIHLRVCASVEAQDLRGAFPPIYALGVLHTVLRDVKLPVGPWGSNRMLSDLNSRGLTGIWFTNWRGHSCLRSDRAAAARHARAAYIQCSLHYGAPRCPHFLRHAFGILMFHCHVHKLTGRLELIPGSNRSVKRSSLRLPLASAFVHPYPLCHDVTFSFACCGSARCGPVPIYIY